MSPDREGLMKKIGLAQKVFSKAQWRDAEKAAAREGRPVGDLLVEQGAVRQDQLRALDRAIDYRLGRDEDKDLARVILDSGYAEPAAVEEALERQKEVYGSTGQLKRLAALLLETRSLSASQHVAARKLLQIARASKRAPDPEEAD